MIPIGESYIRESCALVPVIFSETDIEVYLYKKYYLSICDKWFLLSSLYRDKD